MKGKIVFVNPASRLAAAHIGNQEYIVFEYQGNDHFKEGEDLDNIAGSFGHTVCRRVVKDANVTINVLSSAMDHTKAKLVVSPWHDFSHEEASA